MKLLCLLLATFVLFMATRPCCADDDCKEEQTTQVQNKASGSAEKGCTDCSPFFTCGACTGFIVTKPVFYQTELFAEQTTIMPTLYPQQAVIKMALAIWQPPCLG
jgi:hypothetical protein